MRKKIECLERLFKVLDCRVDILNALRADKVISDDDMQFLLNEIPATHASKIVSMLAQLQQKDKLQLVDYEWTILPKELIKLTLVTPSAKHEFTYSV